MENAGFLDQNEHTNTISSLGNSNFGHSNINLYNNYASASYATYTAPQYTTANPNRCPANANIKPTSSCAAAGDHPEGKTTNKQPLASIRCGHHVLRKSNGNNGGSDTVVANKHERQFNESVIEEGHNNNFVSTSIHSFTRTHTHTHKYISIIAHIVADADDKCHWRLRCRHLHHCRRNLIH